MSTVEEKGMELTTDIILLGEEFLPVKKNFNQAEKALDASLKRYQKMIGSGESVKVKITKEDDKLNLYGLLPGDIEGVIPNGELYGKVIDPETRPYRGQQIGKEVDVFVTDVDMELKCVTVSHEKWRASVRKQLVQQINEAIKNKQKVKLRGRIVKVNYANRILVDLAGVGLLGIVPTDEWKHGHEYHIEKAAKIGTVIEVMPYKYKPAQGTRNESFICSRRALLPDPWDTIEEKYPVNTTFILECVQKKPGHFFGRTAGLELDVYCEYPNEDKNIRVLEGKFYKAVVYRSDKENKALMARVFQEVKDAK